MSQRSDLNFRVEQYANIEELLERARQLNELPQPSTTPVTPAAQESEPAPVKGQTQLAHPMRVNPSEQFDQNLVNAQFTDPEAFSRNRNHGSRVVVKTEGRNHDWYPSQHGGPVGVRVRGAHARKPRTERNDPTVNPSWVEFGVAGRFVEQEVNQAIARLEHNAGQDFSRKTAGASGSVSEEQQYFDATLDGQPVAETTNVAYDPREHVSAWDKHLEELGPSPSQIRGGEGAPLSPKIVAEVTRTLARDPKKT
jgi:hypothetical protein